MRIHLNESVYEAALRRIRWLFDEFPNVVVGISGGKDSTVVFNLALQVARERGRLPLRCLFLDQEAEWQSTIDAVRGVMENPGVEPMWMQIPLRLFNATSTTDHWLECWAAKDEAKWMRPRESYSLKENVYGTDRFVKLFPAILKYHFPDTKSCYIAGVRAEESPARAMGLTQSHWYGGETWGVTLNSKRQHYTSYPIYDWSISDVWKAIHEGGWGYSKLYDSMYQHGVPPSKMRVSNVHHETAVHSLFYLQEIESETWDRLCQRIEGIHMAGKMGADDYFGGELPFMFASWQEYRDYLLDVLWDNEAWKASMRKRFAKHAEMYPDSQDGMCRLHIASILTNDWEQIKLVNFESAPQNISMKKAWQARKRAREALENADE